MKKLISLILALLIASAVIVSAVPGGAVTHGYQTADANDDGSVNMKDVLLLRRLIANVAQDRDVNVTAADVDGNGTISMVDVLRICRIICGIDDVTGNNTDGKYKVDRILIGNNNIMRYTIVYPASAGGECCVESAAYAAQELQAYVKEACGIRLNLTNNASSVSGLKIVFKFDTENEYDLGKEGFVFDVRDNGDFVITCGTLRGALYAAYDFLQDFIGYRFLTSSEKYLYKSEKCAIPAGYFERRVPSAEYRSIGANGPGSYFAQLHDNSSDGGAYNASKDQSKIYGGAVGTTYLHAHSFVYYMAGFENRNDPELNSVAGGEQPCMTSEANYEKIIDFMYKLVEWRSDLGQIPGFHYTQISCSANDNGNFCQCVNCKAVYSAEKSVAGALIRLCNRVTEKFCADYPELEVYTAAYAGAHIPPKLTRPDPRLNICFCSVGCNNHLLRNTEECIANGGNPRLNTPLEYGGQLVNQNNEYWMNFLKGWLELTDNVWYWYYTDNWAYYISSAANLYNFCDDLKYLTELGVKGFYLEGDADRITTSFELLRIYLMTKIMWNPEMTEEEYVDHMNEFLSIYYGPGWTYIKEYIEMENRSGDLLGCWTNNYDYPWDTRDKSDYAENYEHMIELFDAAYAAADNGTQRNRIEQCSVHMNFLGLSATYQDCWVNGSAEQKATFKTRYEWLWNYYNSHPTTLTMNTTFVANESGVGGMWCFPQNAATPCDPMNWLLESEGGFTGKR
ncbi:MAG: DUF4838 domain-containing protein [Clostridia bacterium]|nr:DUF4838 domain-containing protein [Clostridia bacterium]